MSWISDQVRELEEHIENQRSVIEDQRAALMEQNGRIGDLSEAVETLEYDVDHMQKYIEWFEATYPEAKTAWEVAQRVST